MDDVVKQISDALERIFRHLLPGACLAIAARLSHPSWFRKVDYGQRPQLLLLGDHCCMRRKYLVHLPPIFSSPTY
jgi:hypothetical protein